jgi:hypothetical protein
MQARENRHSALGHKTMHIYAIISAPTRDDALTRAQESAFDRLVGATCDSTRKFGYYKTVKEDADLFPTMADGDDLPAAARLSSDPGQKLLARGWNATKTAFENNITEAREALAEQSDEEIMTDTKLRSCFAALGAHAGRWVHLYDEYGNGIRTPEEFVWACKDLEQPWVVPAYAKY